MLVLAQKLLLCNNFAMFFIDGEVVAGTEYGSVTIFGDNTVVGRVEVAKDNRELDQERFHTGTVIPIIGDELFVRTTGFQVKTGPNMFDHMQLMQPPGLITFGVNAPAELTRKPYGTHMDIFLREYAKRGLLSAVIEGIYDEQRERALETISSKIGSRIVSMSCPDNTICVETQIS